jgi:NitT/TauT family transport system substrate-binding protein
MPKIQTRRRFLTTLSMAYAASTLPSRRGLAAEPALVAQERAAEGALETTTVRMATGRPCSSAEALAAEKLLRAEGFTKIVYIDVSKNQVPPAITHGDVDFSLSFVVNHLQAIDHGAPITILAGIHAG